MKKTSILILSILLIAALVCGCAAMEAQKRLQEYEGLFAPMVGKATKADIARKFGDPLRKDRLGSTEMWYYHIPYKDPQGAQQSKGLEGGYALSSENVQYDDLTVEFDQQGYLKSWRGYIQR